MRTMRLMVRDRQSGGLLAALMMLCLAFQAFTALPAVAGTLDPAFGVLCLPLHGGSHDKASETDRTSPRHDCCPAMCLGGAGVPPPAGPDLGSAYATTVLAVADIVDAPPAQRIKRGAIRSRAPPASA